MSELADVLKIVRQSEQANDDTSYLNMNGVRLLIAEIDALRAAVRDFAAFERGALCKRHADVIRRAMEDRG